MSCRVPAADTKSAGRLAEAGFRFVELQIRATLPRLEAQRLEPPRITVRRAESADRARLASIAESAFAFGRYHADPLFPRDAAERRFRRWIERALRDPSLGTRILVVGPAGDPAGFVHTELTASIGDVRLFAADPVRAGLAGPAMLAGALRDLAERGAERVTAQLSAANVAAMNLYATLRFRFHDPELVYHWIRPGAPHLEADR